MSNIPSAEFVQGSMLALLLAGAVATDVSRRRIPNYLVLAGLVLALSSHALALAVGATPLAGLTWWSAPAGLLTGFALLFPLHLMRAMGAGDVKLMAMVGSFIGPAAVLSAALYTLLAGGLLSILFMFGRGVAAQTASNLRFLLTDWVVRTGSGQGGGLSPLQSTAARLPYALAIALGTFAAWIWPLAGP